MPAFEATPTYTDNDTIAYDALADGFPFQVDRGRNLKTAAYWRLPEEYGYLDYLRVVDQMFAEAEANGYPTDEIYTYVLGSSKLKTDREGELTRPFGLGDFEAMGVKDEDITFLRLGDDLAKFYYRKTHRMKVLFEEKPHQMRSAFGFMANLFPSELRLQPAELGQFILGLEKPKTKLRSEPR